MKIALLFAGMYRTHELVIDSWKPILDLKPDVYYALWNKSFSSFRDPIQKNELITVSKVKNLFPTSNVNIQEIESFSKYTNVQKMIYMWAHGLKDIFFSGKKYDIIILSRPDINISLAESFKLEKYLYYTDDKIFLLDFKIQKDYIEFYEKQSNDVFFIGSYSCFRKLLPPYLTQFIHDKNKDYTIGNTHYHVASIFDTLGIERKIIDDIGYNIIRFIE